MDKISSLPDPILCHILSFLPIKSSVATSVLARRWRFLWTYVGNLYFEDEYKGREPKNRMGFSDMVYRVLLQHNGPIDSLSILPNDDTIVGQYQIDAWISTAIARNVRVLCISDLSDSVLLPQCCFKCKSLVELTIEYCTISAKPGTVHLPELKKLSLVYNYYEDDESLPNLLSGCLAIESLVIENDSDEREMACCCVCSPTLKSLVLKLSVLCYDPCELDHEHKLMLDIPAVQYLLLEYDIAYITRAEKLSSLVVADIKLSDDFYSECIHSCYEDEENNPGDEENVNRWMDAFQFLEKLSNAKRLTLRSSALIELLNPTFSIGTMTFHNLTQLKLEADWQFLTELLESAYKLESLTIEKVEDDFKCWRKPKHLPNCLSSSLKYVYIFGFYGRDPEFDMVRYILRHAKVLKRIKIYSDSYGKGSKLDMLQQISYFPRGSKKCRLTFV